MKDFFKDIKTLLIVVLIVIILIMRACSGGGNDNVVTEPTIITETVTKWDTLKIDSLPAITFTTPHHLTS